MPTEARAPSLPTTQILKEADGEIFPGISLNPKERHFLDLRDDKNFSINFKERQK